MAAVVTPPAQHRAPPAARVAEPPAALHAAAALLALLALLYARHAALRLLSPQTGEWLAGSFCSLALFAVATAAAAAGHAAVEASAALGAGGGGGAAGGISAAAWWAAAGLALCTALLRPEASIGGLLLAPGLAGGSSRRISDAQLTLHSMATAVVASGPLFAALGCAAGASASRTLRRLPPASRLLLVVLPLLVGTALVGLALGLPAAALPPRPGSTLPLGLAAVAAAVAALLTPRPAGTAKPAWGISTPTLAAAGTAALAAALLAAGLRQPCTAAVRQLEGGQYTQLWRCELAAGGQLSVVEGTLREQYRCGWRRCRCQLAAPAARLPAVLQNRCRHSVACKPG